jgi:hypothetical protein
MGVLIMKINTEANETMKYLSKQNLPTPDSKVADEINELLEGLGLEKTNDNIMLGLNAYLLGRRRKKHPI